jgi:hypothetical protein
MVSGLPVGHGSKCTSPRQCHIRSGHCADVAAGGVAPHQRAVAAAHVAAAACAGEAPQPLAADEAAVAPRPGGRPHRSVRRRQVVVGGADRRSRAHADRPWGAPADAPEPAVHRARADGANRSTATSTSPRGATAHRPHPAGCTRQPAATSGLYSALNRLRRGRSTSSGSGGTAGSTRSQAIPLRSPTARSGEPLATPFLLFSDIPTHSGSRPQGSVVLSEEPSHPSLAERGRCSAERPWCAPLDPDDGVVARLCGPPWVAPQPASRRALMTTRRRMRGHDATPSSSSVTTVCDQHLNPASDQRTTEPEPRSAPPACDRSQASGVAITRGLRSWLVLALVAGAGLLLTSPSDSWIAGTWPEVRGDGQHPPGV